MLLGSFLGDWYSRLLEEREKGVGMSPLVHLGKVTEYWNRGVGAGMSPGAEGLVFMM